MATGPYTDAELQREKSGEALALPAQFETGESILATLPRPRLLTACRWTTTTASRRRSAPSPAAQVRGGGQGAPAPEDSLRVLVVGDAKTQLPAL
jgi:hypothetical protein